LQYYFKKPVLIINIIIQMPNISEKEKKSRLHPSENLHHMLKKPNEKEEKYIILILDNLIYIPLK